MGRLMQTGPSFEGHVEVGPARLHCRVVGEGPTIVVLHGGPDFDHTYLLPELDRLAGAFRLVYYDQRGRGRSAEGVEPSDVSIAARIVSTGISRSCANARSAARSIFTPQPSLPSPGISSPLESMFGS